MIKVKDNSKKISQISNNTKTAPPPSFIKLAMRNMVRKGGQSLTHLGLTAFGFVGFILVLAWIGRPHMP